MSESQKPKHNSIIAVSECWECPLSYVTAGSTWCSHPDGPRSALHARECPTECPLRKAPALVMLKEQADEISNLLTRLGERLFGDITK